MEKSRMYAFLEELPDSGGCYRLAMQHLEKYRHLLAEEDGLVENTMKEIARELVECAARVRCFMIPADVRMILDRAMALSFFNYYENLGNWEKENMLRERKFHLFRFEDIWKILRREVETAGTIFSNNLKLAAECWLKARERKLRLPGVEMVLPSNLYCYDPDTGRLAGFGISAEEDYVACLLDRLSDTRSASNYDEALRVTMALFIYEQYQLQEGTDD